MHSGTLRDPDALAALGEPPVRRVRMHSRSEYPPPPNSIPLFLRRGYIAAGRRPLLRVLAKVRTAWRAATR